LTFDDPGVLAAAKRDPNGFIAGLNTPVTLDEVQHVPELFPAIKVAVDRKREARTVFAHGFRERDAPAEIVRVPGGPHGDMLTLWPFSQGEMKSVREGFIDALFSKQPVWSSGKSSGIRAR
jgi:predicted AAA+ superfamily ATPase